MGLASFAIIALLARNSFCLYELVEKKLPIPLDYVDIRRETHTSLESPKKAVILDTWWLPASQPDTTNALRKQEPELSAPWAGKTMFNLLINVPRPGFEWCEGEEIKIA